MFFDSGCPVVFCRAATTARSGIGSGAAVLLCVTFGSTIAIALLLAPHAPGLELLVLALLAWGSWEGIKRSHQDKWVGHGNLCAS